MRKFLLPLPLLMGGLFYFFRYFHIKARTHSTSIQLINVFTCFYYTCLTFLLLSLCRGG